MKEIYRFAGFSANFEMYAQVQRHWEKIFEEILDDYPRKVSWVLLKPTTDDEAVKQLCLLFKIGDGQIDVTCQSLPERKRVAVTQLDPLGEQADGDEWPGAAYTDRPATFMAYVDPIGTPSDEDFCWGLKIYLQLSERTEALAKKLIHSWIIDETDKDEMKAQTEQVRNEEWEMIKRWLAEYGLNDVPVKSPKVRR